MESLNSSLPSMIISAAFDAPLRILILEDNALDLVLTLETLRQAGLTFVSKCVETEKDFVVELKSFNPTLILSDYSLPSYDGLSALAEAKRLAPHVPFIFLSGAMGEELAIETLKSGATDYVLKQRLSRLFPAVRRAIKETQERLQREQAEEDVRRLNADLEKSHAELLLTYDATLEGWAHALELRDEGTEGHSVRVAQMTFRLARALGFTDPELTHMRRGALLHDIGKMGIPDRVLLKAGPLTTDEWLIMRKHPDYAREMLSAIPYLGPALEIPYCHHERWDGNGYPRQLKGEGIPLAARLFSIVDIWDALVSERPYHAAWPHEKVRTYLQSLAGVELDPRIVREFLKIQQTGELTSDTVEPDRYDVAV